MAKFADGSKYCRACTAFASESESSHWEPQSNKKSQIKKAKENELHMGSGNISCMYGVGNSESENSVMLRLQK